ncbi:MAG: hypothetical protein A2Z99_05020 [Treponema sp. GWB1_62_6]|nr:MAG: hypothetical protein A2Y36_00570 [Treponema sp. GWA1_62_8]OHE67034.1 MAG: hypothetical protein A2001_08320 [Treponema sp. GWC1_61_84]OHE72569.1 MAG: hypothetical protein A2Z99_05020 [Treponema sp. GWB1_62_6]OHE73279.1 MAG: hypothetical protein A2413_16135 [Treponema sp. RIFOXYC1_FULL_61_9]HCM27339.1 hypothetical protein [Treponema sp.]
MKMQRDEKAAAERMKPGVITSGGFLGTEARALSDIIEADEERFRALGIDFGSAADELERLKAEGAKGLGEQMTVGGRLLVKSDEARGSLPCPYDDGFFHKNSVTLELIATGERLAYSDLSIHLLREHHFCQGEGGAFRLAPDALKRLLLL